MGKQAEQVEADVSAQGAADRARPIAVEVMVRLTALAITEPGGGYSVIVPALRGCYSEGETIEDARANAVEAAEGWLASMHDEARDDAVRACLP